MWSNLPDFMRNTAVIDSTLKQKTLTVSRQAGQGYKSFTMHKDSTFIDTAQAFEQEVVSIFQGVTVTDAAAPIEVTSAAALFARSTDSSNGLAKLSLELRAIKADQGKDAYTAARRSQCQAFCLGHWETRGKPKAPGRLLAFDVDGSGRPEHSKYLKAAAQSPYIARVDLSLGNGTRVWCLADFAPDQRESVYLALAAHLASVFDVPLKGEADISGPHLDTATKDLKRLWFPSWTPPDQVYQPDRCQVFRMEAQERQAPQKGDRRGGKRSTQAPGQYLTEFTTDEKVADLIRQITERGIDLTQGVGDWFAKTLLAIAAQYGEAGRSMAHDISRFHNGYKAAETDQEFDRALKKHNGSVSIASLFYWAKEHGVTFDAQRIIAQRRAQGGKAPEVPAQLNGKPAAPSIQIVPPPPVVGQELPPPAKSLGLTIGEGRYSCTKGDKGSVPVSNFTIRPLYLLRDSRDPKRVWELTNVKGQTAVICCPVKLMSSPREFSALVEGKGNFVPSFTSSQFSTIKEYLFEHEQAAEEISTLGYQPVSGLYAFSNAVFDGKAIYQANEYGIAQINGSQYYLPAFSKVNEDAEREFHNERKFVFQPGKADFQAWAAKLVEVFGENAIIGICHVVAAAFRDLVFERANCFPLLFMYGPKGTGKSTFRLALQKLFGDYHNEDAIGLGSSSSPKGFARKLAQVRNSLVCFEEYKNKIAPPLIEMLKNVYDGIGYERAQTSNDNKTHATLVNSAVILAGQEMPTKENALFSRVLMLTFDKTKFTDGQRRAFSELEALKSEGLGNVLLEILKHRETVAKSIKERFSTIYGHLRQDKHTQHMDERTLKNVAAVLAPFLALEKLLAFPFDYATAYRVVRDRVKSQDQQMKQSSEVSQFWDIVDALEGRGIYKGTHYVLSGDGESLYLNMSKVFPAYYEAATKQNLNALDLSTLESYLSMQPYFVRPQGEGGERLKKRVSMDTGNGAKKMVRCMEFKTAELEQISSVNFWSVFFENTGQ
jgi:hypothetical protein